MVVPFIPSGDETDVCEGVNLYNAARPLVSNSFIIGSVIAFVFQCSICILFTILLYQQRNAPRFRKIRPFFLNFQLLCGFTTMTICYFLNNAFSFPCWLAMFCLLVGLSTFGLNFVGNGIVLTVEGHFASLAEKFELSFDEDLAAINPVPPISSKKKFLLSWRLIRLLSGYAKRDELNLEFLQWTRNSLVTIVIVMSSPIWVITLTIILVVPQYQYCFGCVIFLEVILAFLVINVVYISLGIFVIYNGRTLPDKYGLRNELIFKVLVGGTCVLFCTAMIYFDPYDAGFNRIFSYEWLILTPGWTYTGASIPWQLYLVHQHKVMQGAGSFRVASSRKSIIANRTDAWDQMQSDKTRLNKFKKYLSDHLAAESLHFVKDCKTYKAMFQYKSDKWRKTKATLLVSTYVQIGSLMEVNISSRERESICSNLLIGLNDTSKLFEIFDFAMEDILVNIMKPQWIDFTRL